MSIDLTDKIIVITGGAGLLGRHFTQAIASSGGTAVIAEIEQPAGDCLVKELNEQDLAGNAVCIPLDITDVQSVTRSIDYLADKFGKIDALVNNAYPRNANYGRSLFEVEHADFCENISMHLGGYFLMAQQYSRFMQDQGFGSIINMASIYGVVAPRFAIYDNTSMTMPVEYAVIKSGVIHLTKYLAAYLKGSGVRVNAISPGGIMDAQPQKFLDAYRQQCASKGMLNPEDIVDTLLYLLSDGAAAVNGQNIVVDDGFSV